MYNNSSTWQRVDIYYWTDTKIRKHIWILEKTLLKKQNKQKKNLPKTKTPTKPKHCPQIRSVFNADSPERPITKQQQNITMANIRNLLKPLSPTVQKLNIKASYTLILTYAAKRIILNKS